MFEVMFSHTRWYKWSFALEWVHCYWCHRQWLLWFIEYQIITCFNSRYEKSFFRCKQTISSTFFSWTFLAHYIYDVEKSAYCLLKFRTISSFSHAIMADCTCFNMHRSLLWHTVSDHAFQNASNLPLSSAKSWTNETCFVAFFSGIFYKRMGEEYNQ